MAVGGLLPGTTPPTRKLYKAGGKTMTGVGPLATPGPFTGRERFQVIFAVSVCTLS